MLWNEWKDRDKPVLAHFSSACVQTASARVRMERLWTLVNLLRPSSTQLCAPEYSFADLVTALADLFLSSPDVERFFLLGNPFFFVGTALWPFATSLSRREREERGAKCWRLGDAWVLNALVFLYREVLQLPLGRMEPFVRARRPKNLPIVLTKAEVQSVLKRMTGVPLLVALLLMEPTFGCWSV